MKSFARSSIMMLALWCLQGVALGQTEIRSGDELWTSASVYLRKNPTRSSDSILITGTHRLIIVDWVKGEENDSYFYVLETDSGERYYKPDSQLKFAIEIGKLTRDHPSVIRKRRIAAYMKRGWPSRIAEAVADRKVMLNMTAEQVKMSWGAPDKINRSVGSWGVHEQWVYGNTYLYIKNGKLTSFQESPR